MEIFECAAECVSQPVPVLDDESAASRSGASSVTRPQRPSSMPG